MGHIATGIEFQMSLLTTLFPPLIIKNWVYGETSHSRGGSIRSGQKRVVQTEDKLSATALIGLLDGSKFVIVILDLSLTILPFHLRGLNALIGDIDNFFE